MFSILQRVFVSWHCWLLVLLLLLPPMPAQAFDFSIGDERVVGEKLLSIVRKEFKILDDPDISQYMNELGREMLKTAGARFFDYHFFVVNNNELNAFAAPSGLIFFHTGLLEAMDSEGELVSVIGHEAGHVINRHLARRFDKTAKITAGTMAMVIAGIAMGGGPLSEAMITGSMAMGASMSLKFSRQDEEEADRLAFQWMQDQGRDPAEMLNMLKKLHGVSRIRQGNVPPYLLTHPEPGVRMGYVQDLLLFNKAEKTNKQRDEFAFSRFKMRLRTLTRNPGELISYYKGVAVGGTSESERLMAEYGLALAYQKGAQYAPAEDLFRKLIASYPDRAMVRTDLAVLLFEAGRLNEALVLLREIRQSGREDLYAAFYYGLALEQAGKPEQAVPVYEELLESLPDYPRLYYQLGQIKASQGDVASAFYYLGVHNWYSGQAEAAKTNLQRSISTLPTGNPVRERAEAMMKRIESTEKE